jgi:hypothetical protein
MLKFAGIVMDGLYDHVGNVRLAQVKRSGAGFVQQSIHGDKRFAGVERRLRENTVARETIVETPSEEDRLPHLVSVRESTPVERHANEVPSALWKSLRKTSRPGGRLRTWGPPY